MNVFKVIQSTFVFLWLFNISGNLQTNTNFTLIEFIVNISGIVST